MVERSICSSYSTYLLAKEADSRGIKVKPIFSDGYFKGKSYLELEHEGHLEIIVGQRSSQTTVVGHLISKNKYSAKYYLSKAGINVAKGNVFKINDLEGIFKYCDGLEYPVVSKPLASTHGNCVYLGIDSREEVEKAVARTKKAGFKSIMIEEEYPGTEYRIFATREKFLAATDRIPANVVGNGEQTIAQLVEEKNSDPRRSAGYEKSLVHIVIDPVVKDYLADQKLSEDSIPEKDKQVFLRPNSNLSTGGDSIDITDKIHPGVKELAVKVIQSIPGLAYAGIDYLTKDIKEAPGSDNYIIIEANDSPMLSMHHVPYGGESRDVAGGIIDLIYPETKKDK